MEVAWNQVRVSELVSNKEERDRLFAEIRVLKQLKHKNIMTFYESWLDPKTYCINFITELFTSGTLRQCVLRMLMRSCLWSSTKPSNRDFFVGHAGHSMIECSQVALLVQVSQAAQGH